MNRALTKNLLREIRGSLGRFIAIFAIMALGSGFFAGLRVTKDALVEMGDRYLSQQELYDYRLASTLGLTDGDVAAFAALEGVRTARGATTEDLYLSAGGGAEQAVRIHSITEGINRPYLEAGRMPQAADECLLDAQYADESQLGCVLTVTDSNAPEVTEDLTVGSFTVVGIAQSPCYLNNQLGTSALGTGTVDYFIYVPAEAFARDYYTEIYLTLTGTQGLQIYSDAYKQAAQSMEQPLTNLLRERGILRRQALVEDAMAEYEDALAEYESEKADALNELRDAYNDLKQGEADIVSGQKELDDAKATLEQAQLDLEDARVQAQEGQQQLEDAKAQLSDTRTQLDAAWEQYHAAAQAYGEAAVADTLAQLNASEEQYAAGAAAVAENEAAVQAAWDQIAAGQQEIDDGWADYEEGLADLEDGRKEVTRGWRDYYTAKAEAETEFADAEAELADALEDIHAIPRATTYVLDRETNSGYTAFDCDTSIMTSIARVFPFLFFLIAALVCITTMTRMVEENRTLIGTLKALGYGRGAIAAEFLLYSGVASLTGSIIGFLLGSYVLPKIIWSIYAVMYEITSVTFFFNTRLFLTTVLGYFACAMAATWYVCRQELREVPALLMRPKAPKPGKRIFLERIGFVWRRLGFLQKVAIRNVVQYRQRMLMMVLGIGGCTALLVTGFGLYDSIADIVDYQYGEIATYDYLISFTDPLTAETEADFHRQFDQQLDGSIPVNTRSMELTAPDAMKSVTAIIPRNGSVEGFITLRQDDQPLSFPGAGEIVICQNLADTLALTVGDTVTVTGDETEEMTLTVSGVMENYVMDLIFLSPDSFAGDEPEMNTILANVREGMDLYQVSAGLLDWEEISNVSVTADTAQAIDNSLGSMIYVVYIVIVCSGALAFIVLYNLTNININERIREIATIKVLGFYPRETSAYVMRESLILTGMGAVAGLFAGKALHWYVMAQVKVDAMCFPQVIRPVSYVYAVLLTFLFALLINGVMGRRLKKINMAESLKSIE